MTDHVLVAEDPVPVHQGQVQQRPFLHRLDYFVLARQPELCLETVGAKSPVPSREVVASKLVLFKELPHSEMADFADERLQNGSVIRARECTAILITDLNRKVAALDGDHLLDAHIQAEQVCEAVAHISLELGVGGFDKGGGHDAEVAFELSRETSPLVPPRHVMLLQIFEQR